MPPTRDPITGAPRMNTDGSPSKGCCCVNCDDINDRFNSSGVGFTGTTLTLVDPMDSDSPIGFAGYTDAIVGDTDWNYKLIYIIGGYDPEPSPNPAPNTWKWYGKQLRAVDIRFAVDDNVFSTFVGFIPKNTCVYWMHIEFWSSGTVQIIFEGFKYTHMDDATGRYLNNGQGTGIGQSSMSWPFIDVT